MKRRAGYYARTLFYVRVTNCKRWVAEVAILAVPVAGRTEPNMCSYAWLLLH